MRLLCLSLLCAPLFASQEDPSAIFFDASFIYWYAREEGLTLAETALLNQGNLLMPQSSRSLEQSFTYQPGFKVGLGATFDDEWVVHTEYTWLHNHTSISQDAPDNTSDLQGLGVWNADNWFQQTITFQQVNALQGQSLSGTSIASTWQLNLNLLDLDVSRPYYEGSNLTISPFMGLRAAWIWQSIDVALTQAAASEGGASNLLPQPIYSRNHSHCWAIGPRLGFQARCLLPRGWRLEGSGAANLAITSFTKIAHSEAAQSVGASPGPYRERQTAFNEVLPNGEMGLGIGWGIYTKRKSHFDFAASYDLSVFTGQNVIRRMLDNFWSGIGSDAGNLVFHGLTVSGRYDF